MSIKEFWRKSNSAGSPGVIFPVQNNVNAEIESRIKPFFNLLLIIVIASIFFALGRLSALEERHTPVKIEYAGSSQTASVVQALSETGATVNRSSGQLIGSKTGKKYYFPWCGTVKMIKPENQVVFSSADEARAAGYMPASNCKGLK